MTDAMFIRFMNGLGMPDDTAPVPEPSIGAIPVEVSLDENGNGIAEMNLEDFNRLLRADTVAAQKIAELHVENEAVLLSEAFLCKEHETLRKKYYRAQWVIAVVSGVAFALLGWILGRA